MFRLALRSSLPHASRSLRQPLHAAACLPHSTTPSNPLQSTPCAAVPKPAFYHSCPPSRNPRKNPIPPSTDPKAVANRRRKAAFKISKQITEATASTATTTQDSTATALSLLSLHAAHAGAFNAACYSQLLKELASMPIGVYHEIYKDARYGDLLAALAPAIETAGAREMGGIAHALARVRPPGPTLKDKSFLALNALAWRGEWLVDKGGNAQAVANTAWAFGKLGRTASRFFAAIEDRGGWVAREGKPQEVANVAWALAKFDNKGRGGNRGDGGNREEPPDGFWEALRGEGRRVANEGTPQNIANVAHAFAKIGADAPGFFEAVDENGNWLMEEGKPFEVAITAWAFATLGRDAPRLFSAIDAWGEWVVGEGSTMDVANAAWAIAETGGDGAVGLFHAIDAGAEKLVRTGSGHEVATIAFACAKKRVDAPRLRRAIGEFYGEGGGGGEAGGEEGGGLGAYIHSPERRKFVESWLAR